MLLSTPQGFASAARILCGFPQDLLAELANEVIDFLSYKIGAVDNVTLEKRLLHAGIVLTELQVQGCINVLIFTLRDAIHNNIDAATLSKELKNFGASVFTGKSVNVLKHVWASRGAQACTDAKALPQSVMHVGHLVDFKWKLCLSIESSSAKSLGRAFVATEISVADNADHVKTHSFEMSLYQFQNFAKQLRESNTLVQEI